MITDLKEFCHLFYNMTSIPITHYCFQTNKSTSFPSILENESVFKQFVPDFMIFSQNPGYSISQSFSYFGQVKSLERDELVTIGPIFSTPHSNFTLHNFLKEWAVGQEYRQDIEEFLANTPSISFNRFLHVLAYLHLCINDKTIDIGQHFHLSDSDKIPELSKVHSDQVYETKEDRNYHNTWHFERKLMQHIQNGDIKKIKELLENTSELSEGTLADNALRQRKNIFITSAALTTRSAILGGMDMEQAYQLADVYIQECERSQNIAYVSNLEYSMLMDFTKRVSQNKIPQGMSKEVFDCVQFITHHINEPFQVSDVAEHIGKSRSYLSAKFKKELGFDISHFIMRCKLEEAKSLLTYSNKSLSEISNYLCFSSQSYFQNVFKKKYGLTPKQYRNKTAQI